MTVFRELFAVWTTFNGSILAGKNTTTFQKVFGNLENLQTKVLAEEEDDGVLENLWHIRRLSEKRFGPEGQRYPSSSSAVLIAFRGKYYPGQTTVPQKLFGSTENLQRKVLDWADDGILGTFRSV